MIRRALAALLFSTVTAAAQPYPNASGAVPLAPPGEDPAEYMTACINAASEVHNIPPALLVIILRVEGGRLGRVSPNVSAPPDVGPMQVNAIWLSKLAQRWRTSRQEAFLALRDNFCVNLEAGAWILRDSIDSAPADFWRGVAHYHSRTPEHRDRYLRLVQKQAMTLLEQARRKPAETMTASAER